MNSTNKYRLLLLAALLITGLLSSCLSEDLSDCPRPFQLTIKALDADQVDVTDTGVAGQVVLFVFDENGQIFRTITLTADEVKQHKPIDIQMEFPGHKSLKFVDWSNLDNKVDYSQITSVKQLTDLYVKLNSQNGTANRPATCSLARSMFRWNMAELNTENPTHWKFPVKRLRLSLLPETFLREKVHRPIRSCSANRPTPTTKTENLAVIWLATNQLSLKTRLDIW